MKNARKGRGSVSNAPGRFDKRILVADLAEAGDQESVATDIKPMRVTRIISRNNSPDIPFNQSINPYLGCEHGCIYCYARPSHSYLDLSPGLDFETKIFHKPGAPEALLSEWEKPSYKCEPITIGANTDPYQPAEKQLRLTRRLLEIFLEHRHPVSIITKSVLMSRDLDLLKVLAEQNLVSIAISIPTADNELKRILEPRVPAASARLRLIEQLRKASIPVSLLMAPIIPVINDKEIESIVKSAAQAGVQHASWILLRLPNELKQLFDEWLKTHMPQRAEHVMSLLRQASGGQLYDNRYGLRQRGRGPYAEMIGQRFLAACRRNGISQNSRFERLECDLFRRPGAHQMTLGID